jgi:hypothetical protein
MEYSFRWPLSFSRSREVGGGDMVQHVKMLRFPRQQLLGFAGGRLAVENPVVR